MGKPIKVSEAYDFVASFYGTVTAAAAVAIAFTPVNYQKSGGTPPNAPTNAVPVMAAHEILISNPTANPLKLAVTDMNSAGSKGGVSTYQEIDGNQVASMKPVYIDPTALTAITSANEIVVPPNCVAFPVKLRGYGIMIQAIGADAAGVSIQAYGPLSLLV